MRKPFAGIFAVFYLLCSLWSGLSAQTEDELVDDLSALIRFQTVTRDNDANRAAMEWIVEELAGLPIQVKWYESKGFPSVVITSQETTSPKILLAGHLDVVPGTEESFQPKVEDGRLIGRGAYDMKMGVAAALNIFKALGDDLNKYDDIFDHIEKMMPPYLQRMIPTIKNQIYALTYGSKGWSLADKLYENGAPRKVAICIANDFYKLIYHMYPEVLELKQKCENQLKNTHVMTAIGGVSRYPEQDEGGITKAGYINKLYISRIPLSHTIQGAGATIARKIITKSPKLNFSRLFMPIHDGFIFYTVNDVDMAIREATKLMGKCAREVVDIEMPLKLEWIRSKNMLSYE